MVNREKCAWPGCKSESDIYYSVECKIGFCQQHLEKFFDLQEKKGDAIARAKVGLKPRNVVSESQQDAKSDQ